MKTPKPNHLIRNALKHLALSSMMGAAIHFGASPASAAPPVTAGLKLHLDASQITGLSDGAAVTTWNDMSGLGNNAASAGTPVYKPGILNGQPVVRFNGASSFTTANLSSLFPTAATVFIATTINNGNAYTLVKANPGVDEWWRWDGNGRSYPGVFRGNRLEGYCAMPNSGSHLFAISSSASAWEMSINGASQGVAVANYNAGGALVIGNGSSGGGLNGDIAEVLIYSRVLTVEETKAVGYYLESKYGISSTYENPNPTVPENLQAIAGDGQVSLTWLAFPGAVSYKVKRSGTPGSGYTVVGTPTGPSFTDSPLVNGTPYYYVVSAMTGSESSNSAEKSAKPTGVNATLSTVTRSQPAQRADGVSSITITVTLRNSNNTLIAGKVVTLAATGSPSITTVTGTTGVDGRAVFTATSTTVGTAVFTATDTTSGNLVIAQTAAVDFVDPSTPVAINVNFTGGTAETESALSGPAGGLGTIWNQFMGPNSPGNLVDSIGGATNVSIATNFGLVGTFDSPVVALPILRGSMTDFPKGVDDTNVTISGLAAGGLYDIWMVTLRNQGFGGDGTEQYVGWWSTTNTTSSPSSQLVNAVNPTINTSTFVDGYNYVLFQNVAANGSGQIVFTGVAGDQLNGSDNNHRHGLNGIQIQEAAPVIAGPVNDAMSTVTASLPSAFANGTSTSMVTVTLSDSNGNRVSNKSVTLANTSGPQAATIDPATALNTNSQGQVSFAVRSNTVGTEVFTATVVADSLTLTDTASVEFTNPATSVAYNVNFHAGTPATGLLGVVGAPGETWNQGTTSVSNLTDSTGSVVSSVNVTGANGDGATVDAALNIFDGNRCFFPKAADTTLSITGLVPGAAYDLYIYALSHNNGSWGNFTDTERAAGNYVTSNTVLGNCQSQWLDNGISGVNGSTFVANGNYVVFQSIVSNNLGNISVLADAYDGIDGNPSTGDGDCRLHLSGLQIRPATGMSLDYAAWRDSRYPGLGKPDQDDDGDGLSNDYERIFGMNPTDPGSSSPYRGEFDPATGSLGYTRRVQSSINMNYKVWYSTNLVNWFQDNAALQTVESVSNDVEFMGVSIDPLLLSQPKLFVRVVATPITGLDPEPSLVNLWGSGNSITLLFSEPMNPSSAANPLNYEVLQNGGGTIAITGATLSSDGGSVTLALASALGIDTGYTVNLDGVTSGTGQSLGTGVSRQFKTWDNNPNGIKVFILAGQSNMVGYGEVENGNSGAGTVGSLRHLAVNDASYPDYNYASLLTNPSQPATSPFRTRSDVKVWWRDGGPNLGGTIRKGDLGPPFKGADNGKIGPEFAFGHVIGDFYPSNNVLLVKTSWGGRSLVKDFRSPSAVAARGGRVGDFFSAIIDQTRDVLTNLDTEFPEWSGQGYQIVGFGWHQGFNDMIDATASAEYKDNLPDLIKDVRTVFGKPNLPFVIASTGMDAGPAEPTPYTGYRVIEKAQLWVAGVPKPANVLSTDARPFWRVAAVSPADQGFHWNWNAESYFLIGKSLGDNMVDLLTP